MRESAMAEVLRHEAGSGTCSVGAADDSYAGDLPARAATEAMAEPATGQIEFDPQAGDGYGWVP